MLHTIQTTRSAGVAALFRPDCVAVIGASDSKGNLGGRIIGYLEKFGFPGAVYPVNPRQTSVGGQTCYAEVADLPRRPDLALITVGAGLALEAVRACIAAGIPAGVLYAGGFAEAGEEGRRLQEELADLCRQSGFVLCGPNTLGIIDTVQPMSACFGSQQMAFDRMLPGNVAMISQSGGTAATVHAMLHRSGIGLRALVSAGNEAMLGVADYLRHFIDDPHTAGIGLYVEGARDGADLIDALERLRRSGKRAVMLKSGREEAGARAAAAHTGTLAGSGRVWASVQREFGVWQVTSIREMVNALGLLSHPMLDRLGPRVAIGGWSGVTLGAAVREARARGLEVVEAVDLSAASFDALSGQGIDAVIVAGGEAPAGSAWAEAALAFERRSGLPVLPVAGDDPAETEIFAGAGRFAWADMRGALDALGGYIELPRDREIAERPEPIAYDWAEADRLAVCGVISEHDCHALLSRAGVPVAAARMVRSAEELAEAAEAVGFPVAMKGISPQVTHRSAAGLLALGVGGLDEAQEVYARLVATAGRAGVTLDGVYMQKMEAEGVEVLISVLRDPVFGPVITVGAGGTATELIDDVTMMRAPVSRQMARRMLEDLRTTRLARQRYPGIDEGPLADLVSKVSRLAATAPWDSFAIELNPVIWRPDATVAVDGLIVIDAEGAA